MALTVASSSLIALASLAVAKTLDVPPQAVYVPPSSFAVLGNSYNWRVNNTMLFNPTNATAPIFQVFDPEFLVILGSAPTLQRVVSNPTFSFAHEAPVWVPESDDLFFASNAGGPLSGSGLDANNQMGKISLKDVEEAMKSGGEVNVAVTSLQLDDAVQMTNGGTGPYKGNLLVMNQGRGELPANIAAINPYPPYNVTVLLDNFFGRQFISLNDVKVHPSGEIFFTDVPYGFYQYFKPEPLLPSQVYRFNPKTGLVRVAVDGILHPNGIAFNPDYSTVYFADTGFSTGWLQPKNYTLPATIYAYDVVPHTLDLVNRRVFAYVDTGAADGMAVDTKGNVWASCADGVHVWNSRGTLIGKLFLGRGSANLAFAGKGRLMVLSETEIYYAQVGEDVEGVDLVHP